MKLLFGSHSSKCKLDLATNLSEMFIKNTRLPQLLYRLVRRLGWAAPAYHEKEGAIPILVHAIILAV